MAINFNDNIIVLAGKPIDSRYFSSTGIPYASDTAVYQQIPLTYRYVGLTVNINSEEYWFAYDTSTLIKKGGASSGAIIDPSITLSGTSYGNYNDGDTIAAGTSIQEVLENMMIKTIYPTMDLTPNSQYAEVGTEIFFDLVSSFSQNDAGSITQYTLEKTYNSIDSSLVDNPTIVLYSDSSTDQILLGDELSYTAKVYYGASSKVAAGNIEDTTVITGARAYFYGGDTSISAPISSVEVRSLSNSGLNPQNGTTFSISIPAGATRVSFAYPDTLQAVSTVKYAELGNGEVKDTFSLSTVSVEGANGFTGIDYKVYTYLPAVAFGDSATYNVTI